MNAPTCSRDFVGSGHDGAKHFPDHAVPGAPYLCSDQQCETLVDWYLLGAHIWYACNYTHRADLPPRVDMYGTVESAVASTVWGPVIKAALAERGL